MGKINDYLSKKISFVSMVCMLAVVFIHAYNYTDSYLQPQTIITEGLHPGACIQFFISNAFTRFAVPMFFAISGFLFFYGKDFNGATYKRQVKKRCRSVLSVFVIFSVLSFVLCHLIYKFTGPGVIAMIDERMRPGISGLLYQLLQNPYAFQLWFLAQLFIMCIISPVIYFLVKRLKWVSLVILACLWFPNYSLNLYEYTVFNCDAYMFFTLGAYIAVNNVDIKGFSKKIESKAALVVSLAVWLCLCVVYTLISATAKEPSVIQMILYKLCNLSGMVALWIGYDFISEGLSDRPVVKTLTKNNFMVYLLHEPLLHIIYMPSISCCGSDVMHALLFFVLPLIIVLVCAYFGQFLRNRFPRVSSVLTGGR